MPSADFLTLRSSFTASGLPEELATAVLREYEEVKSRYFRRDYKTGSTYAGRFCEAVARILEFKATGNYTPVDAKIKVEDVLNRLDKHGATLGDALRLHVIRIVRFVYGVRNSRDAGHLNDGIDSHFQDATVIVANLDWVLAELVRVWHNVTAAEATALITGIVTKQMPMIEVLDGLPLPTKKLAHMDHVLVILYWLNAESVTKATLTAHLPGNIRLKRELDKAEPLMLVHVRDDRVFLRDAGRKYVEDEGLLEPSR